MIPLSHQQLKENFTNTTSNNNVDSQVILEEMTDRSQQGSSSGQRISNTEIISQDILEDLVKVSVLVSMLPGFSYQDHIGN